MAKSKKAASASLESLVDAVPVYEIGTYGTIAPLDWKLPLVAVSSLARQIRGDEEGDADVSSYGEIILATLVSAKRQGLDIRDVCYQAMTTAEAARADYEAEMARLADDGCPNAS